MRFYLQKLKVSRIQLKQSVAELNAGIKASTRGPNTFPPLIKPGDVVTYKTGEVGENGLPKTKTVIWTGQATGFL